MHGGLCCLVEVPAGDVTISRKCQNLFPWYFGSCDCTRGVYAVLAPLRQEIAYKFKHVSLPIWALLLAFIGLLMSDGIEHNRFLLILFYRFYL